MCPSSSLVTPKRAVGCKGGSRYVEGWGGFLVSWFFRFHGFSFVCFLVSWFLGSFVSKFLGFEVSWFLGFKVSLFPGFEVSKIQESISCY